MNSKLTARTCWRIGTKSKRSSKSASPPSALADAIVEVDEMYQNAGEKGRKHVDPDDPPRRRANKVRGHGNWDTDRPAVAGVVGRTTGEIRLQVCRRSDRATLQPFVEATTMAGATVNSDEWKAYNRLAATGRKHQTVCHTPGEREWARDEDGDGIREVHCNTMEGLWTGLRNHLRPFRGVNKEYLKQYCAVFEWAHIYRRMTLAFLRAIMIPFTSEAT
jgi:transposase-like protein